jgi:hypothetical protein
MDEASVMMLEDRYRSHGIKNGYVCGAPKLVVDGGRRGFGFDGKTQYLDLNPHAADKAIRTKRPESRTELSFATQDTST